MPLRVTHEIYSPSFLPSVNSVSNGWDVRYETVKEALNKNSPAERAFCHFDTDQKNFFAGNSTGDKTLSLERRNFICFMDYQLSERN